nr:hypothetical protein [Tanacetum cinerariifolium]
MIYFQNYEWYENLKGEELKDEALNSKAIFEGSKGVDKEPSNNAWNHFSSFDEWKDYEHTTYIEYNVSSNKNTYNNVCQMIMNHGETQEKQGWFDEQKLIRDDDDDIGDLEDYLIQKNPLTMLTKKMKNSRKEGASYLEFPM